MLKILFYVHGKRAFEEPPMVAFRRLKNLKDCLVHSGSSTAESENQDVVRCGAARCKCCHHLQEQSSFKVQEREHVVRYGGNCKSSNLIYGVKCSRCDL